MVRPLFLHSGLENLDGARVFQIALKIGNFPHETLHIRLTNKKPLSVTRQGLRFRGNTCPRASGRYPHNLATLPLDMRREIEGIGEAAILGHAFLQER